MKRLHDGVVGDWLLGCFVRIAICTILVGLVTNQAGAQQISLSLGSAMGTPGSIVTLNVAMSATGDAQPAGLQWTMGYSPSNITSVVGSIGPAASAAGKSLQCNYGGGTATCLVVGFNTTPIRGGIVATFAFTIASDTSSTSVPVTLNGALATDAGGHSIDCSGSGGMITISQAPPPAPPSATLSSLSCEPGYVNAPGSSSCTVTLNGAAPAGGFAVTLSDNSSDVTVPKSVTVLAGNSSAQFTAMVSSVTTDQLAVITASANGVTRAFSLDLVAPSQLPGSSCAQDQCLIIPQIADGGGWQTTLVLINTTASATSASLSFFQDVGGGATQSWDLPFLELSSTQNLSLPGGGTLFLHTPDAARTTTEGWAQLQASAALVAYAIFTQRVPGRPDQDGTASAAASASRILVPFDNTNGFVTSIALANPTSASEYISVGIRLSSGASSQPSPTTLPAQGHMAFALPQQFPTTSGQSGLLEFYSASGSFSILGLRFNPTGALTTVPVYSGAATPFLAR